MNSRSNIQSVSVVKLLFSTFMSINTSITGPNSHLFSCCIQLVQQMIYAFTKAKNNFQDGGTSLIITFKNDQFLRDLK